MAIEAAALASEVALVDDEAEVRTILGWIGLTPLCTDKRYYRPKLL